MSQRHVCKDIYSREDFTARQSTLAHFFSMAVSQSGTFSGLVQQLTIIDKERYTQQIHELEQAFFLSRRTRITYTDGWDVLYTIYIT